MKRFRYNFVVEEINFKDNIFINKDIAKDYTKDPYFIEQVEKLKAVPVSIIQEDAEDPDSFHQGLFYAKCAAEEKICEAVATVCGFTYAGSQKHLKNYRDDGAVAGSFVQCKLVSIEQVE